MHRTINIDRAGLYDVLHEAPPAETPLYVVEYCAPAPVPAEKIRESFQERAARHSDLGLQYLLLRVGHLGPDPALLAIWGAASYVLAEPLLRAASPTHVEVIDLGIYQTLGQETL
jgi:hypothetical protein